MISVFYFYSSLTESAEWAGHKYDNSSPQVSANKDPVDTSLMFTFPLSGSGKCLLNSSSHCKLYEGLFIFPESLSDEALEKLVDKVKNEIEVGVCVLNVNARDLNILFKDIIDPLLELKNINIGLGTGDNKYEKHDEIFDNDIEVVINNILKNNNFISNNSTLFIGGNSQSKLDLVQKYNLGINQWMGLDSDFIDKQNKIGRAHV